MLAMEEKKTVVINHSSMEVLLNKVEEQGAAEGHSEYGGFGGDENVTAVLSVYKGVRPAHVIVKELYEWALTNDLSLAARIEELGFKK